MLWLRPHADDSENNPTDNSGRTYATVPADLAQKYVDQARQDRQDVDVSFPTGASSGNNIDILVTDTDSIGLEMPTKKHAPGY
jgi:hypothetical protein